LKVLIARHLLAPKQLPAAGTILLGLLPGGLIEAVVQALAI